MKRVPGPTEYWRFPITGEETWAGVIAHRAITSQPGLFHTKETHHVTSQPQLTQFPQSQP